MKRNRKDKGKQTRKNNNKWKIHKKKRKKTINKENERKIFKLKLLTLKLLFFSFFVVIFRIIIIFRSQQQKKKEKNSNYISSSSLFKGNVLWLYNPWAMSCIAKGFLTPLAFFILARLFWNHIFIWASFKPSSLASSWRRFSVK